MGNNFGIKNNDCLSYNYSFYIIFSYLFNSAKSSAMVQLHDDQKILYMVVSGKLSNDDFDKISSLVHSKVRKFGKIRLYYEMNQFKGWTFLAFWRDLYLDLKFRNKVEKIAMVGEKSWEKWMADIIRPFSGAELRFYGPSRKDEAMEWIKE